MDEKQATRFWQGVFLGMGVIAMLATTTTSEMTKISFGVFLLFLVWSVMPTLLSRRPQR